MINKGMMSSKDMTWSTPQDLFYKLNEVFNFGLDVCAMPETAKCGRYFTPEIDGLKQKWEGYCWMNPPYGREQIKWIEKAKNEVDTNYATVVCLIPARPDTKVWHNIIFKHASAICFIKGRLKFGGSKDAAPFPSALVVFGDDITEEQEECLNDLGVVFKLRYNK